MKSSFRKENGASSSAAGTLSPSTSRCIKGEDPHRMELNFHFNHVKEYFSALDFRMLERRHAKESTMDTQGGSVAEPLAEVRVDVSYEGIAIEKAFQDDRKPTPFEDYRGITSQSKTKEVPIDASSEGPTIDEASRDGGRPTLSEVYLRITNQSKASEDSGGPLEAPKWFKISLWNLATKPGAALLINRIELRHKCSLEFANLVLTEMKNHMETPKILELLPNIVLEAASRGISEIVKLCFEHFPELTWNENFTKKLIEEVVSGRHVELFRLVNSASTIPFLTANTMRKDILMKAVVEWPPRCLPTDVSGAPFVMQRELQWFKKVLQDTIEPSLKSPRLPEDQKPYWDDFVEKRKQLLKEAGQWMKDTSSSCSLVSALINTVAFAAVFTVPGGNNGETGILILLHTRSFMVFAVTDALALFSSVTAALMFLAILTSRYAAEDFLMSLPRKMLLGLTFLFLSLALMSVAFGSALTIILSERFLLSARLIWIYIPITLFAAIPVVLFAILQLPLYFEMVGSTYWPRLYRPLKLWE
ncbi:hypothetical protein NL676_010851 [Syzygium grande]|nr:hypothetical protein NL676_010851 [Syzygium grande]